MVNFSANAWCTAVQTSTDRGITRRVQTRGLVERKTLEAFDRDFQPKLDKKFVLQLAQLDAFNDTYPFGQTRS